MSNTYTAAMAAQSLSNAIDYLKSTRTPAEWPFFHFQPREQAISIIYNKLQTILIDILTSEVL